MSDDPVAAAEKLYASTAVAYLEAAAAYEDAMMTSKGPFGDVEEQFRRAGNESAAALQNLVQTRKAQVPSFEQLLTDFTLQADPAGVVLASVVCDHCGGLGSIEVEPGGGLEECPTCGSGEK